MQPLPIQTDMILQTGVGVSSYTLFVRNGNLFYSEQVKSTQLQVHEGVNALTKVTVLHKICLNKGFCVCHLVLHV